MAIYKWLVGAETIFPEGKSDAVKDCFKMDLFYSHNLSVVINKNGGNDEEAGLCYSSGPRGKRGDGGAEAGVA
jgi:hypothetical protein